MIDYPDPNSGVPPVTEETGTPFTFTREDLEGGFTLFLPDRTSVMNAAVAAMSASASQPARGEAREKLIFKIGQG